jgi:hypothetical protein
MIPALVGSIFASGGGAATNFYSIATQTVGAGGATSITFSSIPSSYTHLQLRYSSLASQLGQNFVMRFNGDSTTSYFAGHRLTGDGTTAAAGAYSTDNGIILSNGAGSNALANAPVSGIMDILDYTNTNKNKTLKMLFGFDTNSAGSGLNYQDISLQSGLWMNTSAISSIVLTSATINQYSTFALYGVK